MYKLNKDQISQEITSVTKTENGYFSCIPFNPDNTDYQAYLKWLAEGNQPLPADE